MNKLFWVTGLAIVMLVCTSMATNAVDPAATSGNTTYSNVDNFGDILGTVPSSNPGPSNAWVGMAYANGYIYQFKNVASPTSTHLIQVNPSTGAVMNDYTTPIAGYVIGAQYDGSGIWVTQWYTVNNVYKLSLTGTTITSWPISVSPYSARSLGFNGTNLWIGCDQSSNVTQLVTYTTGGSMVGSPISSGSAVGWYMDGEVCSDAPANGNYYIVDNVGNTIKRLNVGVSVTVAASVASPAGSPDVAEGIAYNGDDLWHCGAYSSAGVLWRLDDGFASVPPALNVTITPTGSTVVPNTGGSIPFNVSVVNGGPMVPYAVWARVKNPDGSYTAPTIGPVTINTPIGQTITRSRVQNVPSGWASGNYYEILYANLTYSYPVIDADSFMFTKQVVGANGPIVMDATCGGELFPGEVPVSSPVTPASYAVASAFPNPFNPTTTIHFTLPEASRVTLNVYDMNGRLVSTLINGMREAGAQQATFDGSNLSSGVYMYTLNTGANLITGKMALVK